MKLISKVVKIESELNELGEPTKSGYRYYMTTEGDGIYNFQSEHTDSLVSDLIELEQEFCAVPADFKSLVPNFQEHTKDWKKTIKIKVSNFPRENRVEVSAYNGDIGRHPRAVSGPSASAAIFQFAIANGFKSRLKTDGEFGLHNWFLNYNYGLEKRSNEILEEEMDAMFDTQKGTW